MPELILSTQPSSLHEDLQANLVHLQQPGGKAWKENRGVREVDLHTKLRQRSNQAYLGTKGRAVNLGRAPKEGNLGANTKWMAVYCWKKKKKIFKKWHWCFLPLEEGMHTCSVTHLCPALHDLMDSNPTGSSVHGIFQVRVLEWVAISYSRGIFLLKDRTPISCIGRRILYHWAT